MPATTLFQYAQPTPTQILGTELNGLANNAFTALGGAINNVYATANFQGFPYADVILNLAAYSGTPTAGSYLALWFIQAANGSNYDNSGSTISIAPNVLIPLDALASGPYQRTVQCKLPVGLWKPMAQNVGSGITLAASGNTVVVVPKSYQWQ